MDILGVELLEVRLPLREVFEISSGPRRDRRILLIRAEGGEGGEGWGECVAAEAPDYSYETTETAWHLLTGHILPALVGREVQGPEELLAPVSWIRGHPMAKASAEMAIWDLQAVEQGVPLWELLGGSGERVPVGVSIGLKPDDHTLLREIEGYLERGYTRIKLKIKPGRDVEMLGAVRARFPDVRLTVDANSAYTLEDTSRLREMDAFDLLMLEQPLGYEDIMDHARLQRELSTPICLDESIRSAGDVRLALELGACRVVNVKPGRVGGLLASREIHDLCRERDVPVWCGGMLESGVGRAHNLALATLPGFTLPGDISESRRYWERDLVDPEFELEEGGMAPSSLPGIGVTPDRERIRSLAVRREAFGRLARSVMAALVLVLGLSDGLFAQLGGTVDGDAWDVILRGGRLVDGTGNPWRFADVALSGDRIVAVAPPGILPAARARQLLDVTGLVVAPGFIDLNGQSDLAYLGDGSALSKIHQGVTTEIMGESNTPAPVNDRVLVPAGTPDSTAARRSLEWRRFGGWLEEMEAGGVALNVGSFLGGTTVRRYAMGFVDRPPSATELDVMRIITADAMADGAFGVATGLIYPPGAYAGTDELVEVARVAAEYGGIYISHLRSESDHILEALDEAIEIGERSGAPVEVFHLKLAGVHNWRLLDQVVGRIEGARARGLDVSASMYPYTAASTGLTACFPPWVQEGGALYRNLEDPATRERIRREVLGLPGGWENWCRLATPEGSVVSSVSRPEHRELVGLTLEEVAAEMGAADWVDAAMDLVLAERSRVGMIYFAMSERNVRAKMALPWIKFGTDGAGWNPAGALGRPHPRAYGTYSRILGRYVREEGVLSLEDAVRKSTSAVADRIGLRERGLVRKGFYADVVVFDPATIEERATFEDPHRLSDGMVHVFVNGEAVLRHGMSTSARPGRFVRGPGAVTPAR